MYISDKDALQYASRLILIIVPFFSSLFDIWSWVIEILLLFAVFIHSRDSGLRLTAIFLAAGYLASIIIAGGSGFSQIGFTPWSGVLFLGLKERGMTTSESMFWGLMTAVLLSALPLASVVGAALQPEYLQQKTDSILHYYEQQGSLSALEKQGITADDFERYLGMAVPVYYRLMPSLAGIGGMLELGLVFLVLRSPFKKNKKYTPFALWRLPWYAVWVAIIGLAFYLGGDFLGVTFLEIAGMNLMVIIASIALLLGFSCLSFAFKHPKVPRIVSWIIILIGVFFPYYVLSWLVFIGLFDLVMNFRRIPEKIGGLK